jgi:hypothetical protein
VQIIAKGGMSELQKTQLRFWTGFVEFLSYHGSPLRCQKPAPRAWANYAMGRSGIHLTSIANAEEVRAEFYLEGPRAKAIFAALEQNKANIEENLGLALEWYAPQTGTNCRLITKRPAGLANETTWPELYEWLRTRLEKMHAVFAPLIPQLDVEVGS